MKTGMSCCRIPMIIAKTHSGRAVPVEVKSGTNLKAKSLAASIKRFDYDLAIRFSAGKPSRDGAIIDLPLYAVESLPKILEDPERFLGR
ncbi:hypothetical protein DW029_03690 [Collinsella sp. AF38-3AC]|nr:hypothetical protein DW029_03690 [Collinsella sp. AF38-3AC]